MVDIEKNKITPVFLGILVLVAVGVVLKYAAGVILPLIIAWLLSFLIAPVVNIMTRRKVPTTLAVFIILILLLGVVYLSGTFLYTRITAFAAAYPRYHSRMTELIPISPAPLPLKNVPKPNAARTPLVSPAKANSTRVESARTVNPRAGVISA